MTPDEGPAIRFAGVTRRFRPRRGTEARGVLDLTFEVAAGEIVCLVGVPGAGKSTILRLAAGLEHPDAGTVQVAGELATSPAAHARIGFVPAAPVFPRALEVREALAHFAALHPNGATAGRNISITLETWGLGEQAERRVERLGAPERRRLGMAQAALGGRRILLLDETLQGVDPVTRRDLGDRLQRFAGDGAAVLLTASDPVGLERVTDRFLILHAGRVVHSAATPALLGQRVLEVTLDAPPREPPPGFRLTRSGMEADLGTRSAEAALALCRAHRLAVRGSRVRLKSLDEVTFDALTR
ncbi:MAG TPA: ABC transporter ATP-binding protein [Gemmatimonadales bacterium]|nr:ABC transporter ATP-binding protein [Gemmatimonadales bacterium]